MGCFSFLCKECNEPVYHDWPTGDDVKLYLLEEGKVIESLEGMYTGYGATHGADWQHGWDECCRLMFDKSPKNGIAAVHKACCKGSVPTSQSESDPGQGFPPSFWEGVAHDLGRC